MLQVADCLKTFGLSEADEPALAEAAAFLLRWQNPDGSWGLPQERSIAQHSIASHSIA